MQQQLQKLTGELNETTKKLSRAKVKESVDTNKITKLQAMIESHKRERDQEDGELSDRESKIPKSQWWKYLWINICIQDSYQTGLTPSVPNVGLIMYVTAAVICAADDMWLLGVNKGVFDMYFYFF